MTESNEEKILRAATVALVIIMVIAAGFIAFLIIAAIGAAFVASWWLGIGVLLIVLAFVQLGRVMWRKSKDWI